MPPRDHRSRSSTAEGRATDGDPTAIHVPRRRSPRAGRRRALRRFGPRLARWLRRHAGPEGLVARYHADGEMTLEVEPAREPGQTGPLKVRIIVADSDAD